MSAPGIQTKGIFSMSPELDRGFQHPDNQMTGLLEPTPSFIASDRSDPNLA
jgi:hypothetical protein